jgi:hypothetical protein
MDQIDNYVDNNTIYRRHVVFSYEEKPRTETTETSAWRQDEITRGQLVVSEQLKEAWESAPTDPDPLTDLDYEYKPLTHIHVEEGEESYIFLPEEEQHLADAEFIVATPEVICRLDERR